jgi:hypothetical protein
MTDIARALAAVLVSVVILRAFGIGMVGLGIAQQ